MEPTVWNTYRWPAVVVVLLSGHMVLITGGLLLSSTLIPGASVAPAGYAEALAWDDLKAAQRASDDLGWSLDVTPTNRTELNGDRWVTFTLRDDDGEPILGAQLDIILYHHSRPHEPLEVRAAPSAAVPGDYVAAIRLQREGSWRLQAIAAHQGDRYLVDSDLWIGQPKGSSS